MTGRYARERASCYLRQNSFFLLGVGGKTKLERIKWWDFLSGLTEQCDALNIYVIPCLQMKRERNTGQFKNFWPLVCLNYQMEMRMKDKMETGSGLVQKPTIYNYLERNSKVTCCRHVPIPIYLIKRQRKLKHQYQIAWTWFRIVHTTSQT